MTDHLYLAESRTLLALADALDASGASRLSTATLREIARKVMGGSGIDDAAVGAPTEGPCEGCESYCKRLHGVVG